MSVFDKYESILSDNEPMKYEGVVRKVVGLTIEGTGPIAELGEMCEIVIPDYRNKQDRILKSEVVGFKDENIILMALGDMTGIAPGCTIRATGSFLKVPVSNHLLGRVLDGTGEPIDGKGNISSAEYYSIFRESPNTMTRQRIKDYLSIGVKAIDGLNTIGKGQRMGIFSGSGIGKSTLLGMIARNTSAEVNVIALIGERGREVMDFLEKDLGEDGLKRSVVVVVTSDKAPLLRMRGAYLATTIAEYFRDQGKDVILMMDSITRFARAQREVGLAIGEPPSTRGYTPSVFATLPKLLERAGTSEKGSITGFYTVLVEADDMNEPIADNVRAIVDGHVVLSRDLAVLNHYPAIDILGSISRLMIDIVPEDHMQMANMCREILATYKEAYDLINIGAYVSGSNPRIDNAIEMIDKVNGFLKQGISEKFSYEDSLNLLTSIFKGNEDSDIDDNKNRISKRNVKRDLFMDLAI